MRTRADSPTKNCTSAGCERPLRARGLCTTHYNQSQPNRHVKRARNCEVCDGSVLRAVKSDRRPVCSVACRSRLSGHSTEGSGYSWAVFAASRARLAGATVVEVFDRLDVFERDQWACGICGKQVDREADPLDPMSATVDHVVPLSRGGQHTLANAQCACLGCNSAKQDRLIGSAA